MPERLRKARAQASSRCTVATAANFLCGAKCGRAGRCRRRRLLRAEPAPSWQVGFGFGPRPRRRCFPKGRRFFERFPRGPGREAGGGEAGRRAAGASPGSPGLKSGVPTRTAEDWRCQGSSPWLRARGRWARGCRNRSHAFAVCQRCAGPARTARRSHRRRNLPAEGDPLHRFVSQRGLSCNERLQLFGEVLDVVIYAHGQGVVHRDLKPQNILVQICQRVAIQLQRCGLRNCCWHRCVPAGVGRSPVVLPYIQTHAAASPRCGACVCSQGTAAR
jgi:hypothetical protein